MKRLLMIPYTAIESMILLNIVWSLNDVPHKLNYWTVVVYIVAAALREIVITSIFRKKVEK